MERPLTEAAVAIRDLNAWYDQAQSLFDIHLDIVPLSVTAAIGPSGSGKSTFVRCLNRMHEEVIGARVTGSVEVEGVNIYSTGINPMNVRRHIGMVFQQPNPLPTRSIYENVAIGARINGLAKGQELDELVRRCLGQAALWDEVKDRLRAPPTQLSGGQQQRLCIARALALDPRIVLMDEPCSALDPIATLQIEDLIKQLAQRYTIVIVTHNLQQAARIADRTAFFLSGRLIEENATAELFSRPKKRQTEDFITGRFG
ncbi:MAG TPA: phosphate ABC transporter ATP-binding protein PstB [Ktedonobacterales bacterium]|nr:phosphate ABC transporter ATP-binding protein PstB [Ktedonobacterales bacterium]